MRVHYVCLIRLSLGIAGCGFLDAVTGVNRAPGDMTRTAVEQGAEIGASFLPQPWGEIVLSSIITLQNAYLLYRRKKARLPAPVSPA
jgi:hypothetical protein